MNPGYRRIRRARSRSQKERSEHSAVCGKRCRSTGQRGLAALNYLYLHSTRSRPACRVTCPAVGAQRLALIADRHIALDLIGNRVRCSERSTSGVALSGEATPVRLPDGSVRRERSIDDAVLTFLALQSSSGGEILARSPRAARALRRRANARPCGACSRMRRSSSSTIPRCRRQFTAPTRPSSGH